MSNLKNSFTSRLTAVAHTIAKDGANVYTGTFENGASSVIRTSNRKYASVTQILSYHSDYNPTLGTFREYNGPDTDFLFSARPRPSLTKYQQNRVVATVQVVAAGTDKTDQELAAYQPKVVLDAITNALRK